MSTEREVNVRDVFAALSQVVTRLESGQSQPRTVVTEKQGHVLVSVENKPASPPRAAVQEAATASTCR